MGEHGKPPNAKSQKTWHGSFPATCWIGIHLGNANFQMGCWANALTFQRSFRWMSNILCPAKRWGPVLCPWAPWSPLVSAMRETRYAHEGSTYSVGFLSVPRKMFWSKKKCFEVSSMNSMGPLLHCCEVQEVTLHSKKASSSHLPGKIRMSSI